MISSLLTRSLRSSLRQQRCGMRLLSSSYPPHQVVGLPSLSPTMESGSIANWNLKVGDSFGAGDVLCSVETDKATVDFEAQDEGVLAKILKAANSGDIAVGDPIMITVDDADDVAAFENYTLPDPVAASAPTARAVAVGAGPAAASPTPSAPLPIGNRVVASPLARLLASSKGYNLAEIVGTGPDGRIVAADVEEFQPTAAAAAAVLTITTAATTAQPPQPPPPIQSGSCTDYPISQDAQLMAARLMQSKHNVPHYYLTVDIAVDEILKLNLDIGVYEFMVKAAAVSMKTVPAVNASWMESFVRHYKNIDINIVTDEADLLLADVAKLGLSDIRSQLDDDSTASGGLGTFTIMNLGMYGIKSCAPIVREPQACALAIGALEMRVIPGDGGDEEFYKYSTMCTATLSCDHRVVDGAVGAQWLKVFKDLVENPVQLLL